MPFDFHPSDLATVGLLVLLEGLLSADNALVLAILVLGLPPEEQKRALRYGIAGAFGFRVLALMLVRYLMEAAWVKVLGGAYLCYLALSHFRGSSDDANRQHLRPAKPAFGLSAFWATVVRVEAIDIAFSVDSILVAVAMSDKLWVVITGGLLGIATMRLVAGRLIELIRRYPPLVDGAFIIVGWVGFELLLEFAHDQEWVPWVVPKSISLSLIAVIFLASYLYARRQGPAPPQPDE